MGTREVELSAAESYLKFGVLEQRCDCGELMVCTADRRLATDYYCFVCCRSLCVRKDTIEGRLAQSIVDEEDKRILAAIEAELEEK